MKKSLKFVFIVLLLGIISAPVCDAQKKKKSEFKLTKTNKSTESYADNGITSPVHEKYARKLVFSCSPFKEGVENEGEFKKEFTSNENIYIRAYMPHSIMNHPVFAYPKGGESPKKNIYGEYHFKVTIDGVPLFHDKYQFEDDQVSSEQEPLTVLPFVFLPDPSIKERDKYLLEALNNLSLGDHVVRMEMHTSSSGNNSREPICTGEFVYKKMANEKMAIGKTWSQYECNMKNDKLKGQMIQLMKDFAGKEGWKAEIGGVKIVDRDWNIERNEITGIILNRWIAAQVYIKYNDGICKVCRFVFEQNHNGSDYSEYLSHNAGGKIEEVDCE